MQLPTSKIIAETEDGIGWLVFNNPERRNAVSTDMWEAVKLAMRAFEHDPGVRAVVVRGAGDKAFVSGADISEFEEKRNNAEAGEAYARHSSEARAEMATLSKPLIAMIRGFCIGGGMSTAMAADIRIAADDAQFGIPAARLGLSYAYESLRPLVQLVGPAVAKEMLFTGRRFGAEEALRLGLVNRVVPAKELEQTTRDYARMIVENAPLTIRSAKFTINEIGKDPADRDRTRMQVLERECMDSQDYAEGRRAFLEKRRPIFRGE